MVLQTGRSPRKSTRQTSSRAIDIPLLQLKESDLQRLLEILNSTSVTRSPRDSTEFTGDDRVTLLSSDSSALLVRSDDSNPKSFWLHRIDVDQPDEFDQQNECERLTRLRGQPLRLFRPQAAFGQSKSFLSRLPYGWLHFDNHLWLAVELKDAQLLSTMISKWGAPPPKLGELMSRLFPDIGIDQGSALDGPPWVVMSGQSEIAILQPLLNEAQRLVLQSSTNRQMAIPWESTPTNNSTKTHKRFRSNGPRIPMSAVLQKRAIYLVCGIIVFGFIAWSAVNAGLGQKRHQVPAVTSKPELGIEDSAKETTEDFSDLPSFQSSSSQEPLDLQSFTESRDDDDKVVQSAVDLPILPTMLEESNSLDVSDLPKILEENNETVEAVIHESSEGPVVEEVDSIQKSFVLRSARTIEKFRVDKSRLGKNAKALVEIRIGVDEESPKAIAFELAGKEKKKIPLVFDDDDEQSQLELEVSSVPGRLWEVEFALWTTIDRTQGPIRVDVGIAQWISQQMRLLDQRLQQQLQLRREFRANVPSAQRGLLGQEIRAIESQQKSMVDIRDRWQQTQKSVELFFESHEITLSVPKADNE